MPRGRPLAPLTLTDEQEDQLNGIAQSATLPYALVVRTRMILASAEGLTNSAVARRFGVTQQTVGKWRRRFRAAGIEGLHDELRPGRPRTYDDDKVAASCIPSFCQHQITPKTSRHTRCSMSMFPNVSINGRIRSSGQLGRWWYSISPCRNNECVRRFTVFAFNQRS